MTTGPDTMNFRGAMPAATPRVAIVGARAATGNGLRAARELAADLARSGALVLSGGAIGVDAAAHAGALAAGAPTVAVLASGLDAPYPARNRLLFQAILDTGGALASPFPDGSLPLRWRFLQRNQVLAQWADAVVVIEAQARSGSLSTARAGFRLGRVVGARPGSPGTDLLVARGAAVVESAADLLAALAGAPRRPELALPESGSDESLALAALDDEEARPPERVAALTGLAATRAARALSALYMEGLAIAAPGGKYLRSQTTTCPPS